VLASSSQLTLLWWLGSTLLYEDCRSLHEAEELASTYLESTFYRVEAHVVFAEFPEDFFQVRQMLVYVLRLDHYVVHIYLDVSSNLLFEDSVHQSLVCRACVFEAERHDSIVKVGIFSDKCHFSSSGGCILIWLYSK